MHWNYRILNTRCLKMHWNYRIFNTRIKKFIENIVSWISEFEIKTFIRRGPLNFTLSFRFWGPLNFDYQYDDFILYVQKLKKTLTVLVGAAVDRSAPDARALQRECCDTHAVVGVGGEPRQGQGGAPHRLFLQLRPFYRIQYIILKIFYLRIFFRFYGNILFNHAIF